MKKFGAVTSLLFIIGVVFYSFYSLMPSDDTEAIIPDSEFSIERALIPLKEISKAPHYLGSIEHERVRLYLISQLKSMGLQVEEQTGFVLQEKLKSLDKPKNIIGRIKGATDGKALLLLSHYDSAKIHSHGASDAGSGVVTIIESVRAFLSEGITPQNDIIVLFTDGEELGLDGAKLFVNEHPWATNIGLALNFEARGSGGPSNMILESNQGNKNLIKAFIAANPEYPVASSLMYSVYKMLPNSTDSTVFREDGDIDSFFFAFIDDHFDYHTANDTFENLDRKTLQHQGSYLLPLLRYFASADLSSLKSNEDYVYVNFPFVKMISYPFSWILWMLVLSIVVFIVLIFYGHTANKISGKSVGKGFAALLLSLILSGLIGFFGWKLLNVLYPHYSEIQQGFTYNGHSYIAFFVFLSLAILFAIYRKFGKKQAVAGLFVAPIALWIIINTIVFLYLEGAAYFIIPVFFSLVSFWLLIRQERPSLVLLSLFAAPAMIFYAPLIQFFPVALGLKMVVISCVFTVLTFGLLVSVFGFYRQKRIISILCLLIAIGFFIRAHFTSDFSENRQKPNSLVYFQNNDNGTAYWASYDKILDDWTKGYLGESPGEASKYVSHTAVSKYKKGYQFATATPSKDISSFDVAINSDSVIDNTREVSFTVHSNRSIHQLLLYADTSYVFKKLIFNGEKTRLHKNDSIFNNRTNPLLLSYYITDRDSLNVSYTIGGNKDVEFTVVEYSFDLLKHPQFSVNKRTSAMTPKPFVSTDAVVVSKSFNVDSLIKIKKDTIIEIPPINE